LLLISIILFYVVMLISGNTFAGIRASGWLLGPFPSGALWKPFNLSLFTQVDWHLVASQVSNLFVIGIISIVAMLLNVSALELIAQKDIDTSRELEVMGLANIVTSLLGGSVSYHYLSLSGLTMRMKTNSRLVGASAAVSLGVVLFFGASALSLMPKFAIGGLLVFLGASFLLEWVYDAYFRMPKLEYLLVLAILAVVGGVGFLEGVGVGLIGAVILFAVNYGRIDVVNDALTSSSYRSTMERPPEQYRQLERLGGQINILRLHGFVFFGTASGLLDRIRARINDSTQERLKYLILDFHRVTSLGFLRCGELYSHPSVNKGESHSTDLHGCRQ
jgi:SulP family sulfate permease